MALSPQSAPASTLTAVLGWNGSRGAAADGPAASTTLDMVDVDEAGPAEIDIPAGAIYLVHDPDHGEDRSEEHTSELQSRFELVCRLLLEKKNTAPRTDR